MKFDWIRTEKIFGKLETSKTMTGTDQVILESDILRLAKQQKNPQQFYTEGRRLISKFVLN